ncbi:response regulator [Massilia norwichensis]|uniref:Response regulator transcription factor n=1 Tax=Massilia norwichensis TaxID=1442366 RepID=A0ABT2AC85_9BURK|nr:response regulator transcription factor [Massilia norwichensis]MCS0591748.1 response regulator transcription factor [Massilia norwichensis]
MIRTLLAEANPVARLGMRSLLRASAEALEIDEVGSHAELLAKLSERYYEFIIVEPAIGGADAGSATALVERLHALAPWADILVFTALDELSFGVGAIRHGAKGYLMKTAQRDEFKTAVKRVAGGKLYLSKALAEEFAACVRKYDARNKPHESFSRREFEVFALAVCGMTVIESAQLLHLDTGTVGDFKRDVMSRLDASTPQGLVEYATTHGLSADCSAACAELWSGRFGQAAATPSPASQSASAVAGIGLAIR